MSEISMEKVAAQGLRGASTLCPARSVELLSGIDWPAVGDGAVGDGSELSAVAVLVQPEVWTDRGVMLEAVTTG